LVQVPAQPLLRAAAFVDEIFPVIDQQLQLVKGLLIRARPSTLGAFAGEVKAQAGRTIASGQAATLIASARRIQAVLAC
jgi:hypothetical protein